MLQNENFYYYYFRLDLWTIQLVRNVNCNLKCEGNEAKEWDLMD